MTINFKKINTKSLIIPLSLIVLGGINNSIQAMDESYGKENIVDVNNNNNIINTNKLNEQIKFSAFKNFIYSLYSYETKYLIDTEKEKIEKQCANFIKLLPQYIQNNTNGIAYNEICTKQHSKQKEDSMISYKTCLHYLLNLRCFCKLDCNFHRSSSEYNAFLERLFVSNLKKDEYKKILIIILNNLIDCFLRACPYDESGFRDYDKLVFQDSDPDNTYRAFFEFFVCKNPFYRKGYDTRDDNIVDVIKNYIIHIVKELAEIEYSNDPSMSKPVSTISDKIMSNLIMPRIKKTISELLYLYGKKRISNSKQSIINMMEDFEYRKNKFKERDDHFMEQVKKYTKFTEEDAQNAPPHKHMQWEIKRLEESIQECRKDLEILQKDDALNEMINKAIFGKENEVKELIKDWPESIQELRELTSQVNKSLANEVIISKIREQLKIDNKVYKAIKNLRKEEVMNTFSKKAKVGNKTIKSKYIVKQIHDYAGKDKDGKDILMEITKYTSPVAKQEVNENNESKEVNINNESEKK